MYNIDNEGQEIVDFNIELYKAISLEFYNVMQRMMYKISSDEFEQYMENIETSTHNIKRCIHVLTSNVEFPESIIMHIEELKTISTIQLLDLFHCINVIIHLRNQHPIENENIQNYINRFVRHLIVYVKTVASIILSMGDRSINRIGHNFDMNLNNL
jgi:hypothetical protein